MLAFFVLQGLLSLTSVSSQDLRFLVHLRVITGVSNTLSAITAGAAANGLAYLPVVLRLDALSHQWLPEIEDEVRAFV